jgi:hypothetical protein
MRPILRKLNRLNRIVQLPPTDRRLLMRAAAAVIAARLVLWFLPLSHIRRRARLESPRHRSESPVDVRRVAWAVRATARRIPRATCLTQALALQRLLAREGRASEIRIGVAKGDVRGFESHAWVQCAGHVILGGEPELDRYCVLLTLPGGGI